MEKVGYALEQRISSLSNKSGPEEPKASHSQLLTSPSMDSLGGMGSAGAWSPNQREEFLSDIETTSNGWPDDTSDLSNIDRFETNLTNPDRVGSGSVQMVRTVSGVSHSKRLGSTQIEASSSGQNERLGSTVAESIPQDLGIQGDSTFAEIADQPVEETIVVGPGRTFHGLTRDGFRRHQARKTALERIDPVGRWKEHRTLLILWLVTAIITFVASLQWLQVGMWAGVLGFIGPSFSVCNCCTDKKLPLNLQVTRIFAVSTSALSTFAAVLFTFLVIKLPCPIRHADRPSCGVFRAALVTTAIWHLFHALVSGLVSARASKILSDLEPLLTRKVLLVQNNRTSPV